MKLKSSWILFVPALIAAVALQLYDSVLELSNKSTSFTVIGICAALLLGVTVFAATDKYTVRDYAPRKNIFSGITLGLGGTLVAAASSFSILDMLGSPINVFQLLTAVAGVAAAVVLLLLGINSIVGSFTLSSAPVVALMPTIYYSLMLVNKFLSYTKEAVASAQMYDLLYLVLLIIFFYYAASIFAGIPTKNAVKCCFVFGMPAVVMILAWCSKMLYPVFTGAAHFDLRIYIPELQAGALALFIVSFLIEISLKPSVSNYFDFDNTDFSEEEEIYGKKTQRNKADVPAVSPYTKPVVPASREKLPDDSELVVHTSEKAENVEKTEEPEKSEPAVTPEKETDTVRETVEPAPVEEKAPKKSTLSEQAEDYRTALNSYEEQIIKEKEPETSPDDDMGWIDKLIKEIEEEQKNG